MRDAPALAGVTGKPARPNAPRRAKTPVSRGGRQGSLVGRAFARPGVTIAGAVFAALMAGIVANALFLQKGHHPSPLLGAGHERAASTGKLPPPAETPRAAAPAPAPTASDAAEPQAPVPTPSPVAPAQAVVRSPASLPAPPKAKPKAAPRAHSDPIGQLLGQTRDGSATKTPPKPATKVQQKAAAALKPQHPVASAPAAPHT